MRRWFVVGALALLIAGLGLYHWLHTSRQDAALLRSEGEQLQGNTVLLAYASQRAQPLYKKYCAGCHGADLKGNRSKGIPNLGDGIWLYGAGQITEIEQTILYGIRSGHPKAHNLADMPGFGRLGLLAPDEVEDVVEYVLQISHQPHNAAAAERGKLLYQDRGACYDCHALDGYGISDYGTPGLTGRGGSWLYGGDRATLYKSIFDGRHGLCPAWIDKLSFAEIRALAAFLYSRSHSNNEPQNAQSPHAAGA
ncbi:MAG: c-type cytochrome [Steroidobacteraceae bacterium]